MNLHDISYSRLLQIPEDERQFMTIEELKPIQLTEYTTPTISSLDLLSSQKHFQTQDLQDSTTFQKPTAVPQISAHKSELQQQQQQQQQDCIIPVSSTSQQNGQIYFKFDAPQNTNDSCSNSMYMGNVDMTQTTHNIDPSSIRCLNSCSSPTANAAVVTAVTASSPVTATVTSTATSVIAITSVPNAVVITPATAAEITGIVTSSPSLSMPSAISNTIIASAGNLPQNIHQIQGNHIDLQTAKDNAQIVNSRKRKITHNETSDLEDDDAKSTKTTDESKKQNHSEIEKRRRDKMNTYITELSSMVPMCHAMSRKLDKLTVLRMTVQHLKTIRGAVHSYTEGHYKPAFLSDQELKSLILQAAEGFLFVVGCDRGRIQYVSESVSQVLNYTQSDLLGQSWFDILHPKDVAKVKEQLSSSDLSPRERLIDAKTMLPVKTDVPQGLSRLYPGARRSFFCRMKCKASAQIKEESDSSSSCHRRKKQFSSDKRYCVIQCTGYLKSWAPAKVGIDEQEIDSDGDSCNLSCLVAIGRILPNVFSPNNNTPTNNYPNLRNIQFISRHAMDGKFLFVDQRATLVLGFLPQELLGTSMYEYYHQDDIPGLAESHKLALQTTEKVTTLVYRFRIKDNDFVCLQSEWKSFKNPWTKEFEYLIAKNSVILSDFRDDGNNYRPDVNTHTPGNFDFLIQNNKREIHRIINTHVEASKIGRQIAEQVLDYQRKISDSSSESSPDPDSLSANQSQTLSSGENSISTGEISDDRRMPLTMLHRQNGTLPNHSHIRNNNSMISNSDNANDGEVITENINSPVNDPVIGNQIVTSDGNDEAAMAVIMSLLEADAGLGGPVDFTGLPWPLP